MRVQKISFEDTRSFSNFFLNYTSQQESLKKFYALFPTLKNFELQIQSKAKSFTSEQRNILASSLTKQYKNVTSNQQVEKNISLLTEPTTFTITTGHQLNIFTGPLYFIYKIATVINACKELKKHYPVHNFVPVYWMASEDHDYDEIKYFRLYGKKYTWETPQQGAVGRFNPKSIDKLLAEIPGDTTVFKNAYLSHDTLSNAVRHYVHELFGNEGLVVIDADDHELKKQLRAVISDDLFNHTPKKLVEHQNKELEALGYHTQVFAREVNFFYLNDNLRSRIERKEDRFQVVDTSLSFSRQEIEEQIENTPEKFSPNVILRPLYQEIILPNLAYAGGPAEVVYWLQLKSVFDYHHIPFPMLMPRNFAMVVENNVRQKFEKTGLEYKHLFEEKNFLFNQWIVKNSTKNLSIGKELALFSSAFADIRDRAAKIDSTLLKFVEAQAKRSASGLERIEHKMLRAEKRVHKEKLGQIEVVKDTLFPNGSPQERVDNFLNFYQKDSQFIKKILAAFDPFDFQFNILFYDEG